MKIGQLTLLPLFVLLTACASDPLGRVDRMADQTGEKAEQAIRKRAAAENVERVTDTQNLGDAVLSPLSDLNLKRQTIPPKLANMASPYSRRGTRNCRTIVAEIDELDELLGKDFDVDGIDEADLQTKAYNMTSKVVGSFVPFRGMIRAATGASQYDRLVRRAYRKGVTRRAYLKGVAAQKRCK